MASEPQSVGELLLQRIRDTPQAAAYRYPQNEVWKSATWGEFGDEIRSLAMGLRGIGLASEERVAILSVTRYEWILADFAVLSVGGATTTIYPTGSAQECSYILRDSDSVYVVAENDEQVAKLLSIKSEIPRVRNVIVIDGNHSSDGWVLRMSDVILKGRGASAAEWEAIIPSVKPTDIATIMYTSGTTGVPKGVVLPHSCWLYEGEAAAVSGLLKATDIHFLWLPLAHSFGKVLEVMQLKLGFQTAVDGRAEKLVENLALVKPTVVAAVPRVFEKVHNRIVEGTKAAGGAKWAIFKWALGVGREAAALRRKAQPIPRGLAMRRAIADRLVFSKVRERFGGNIRYFVSGSAPLSMEMGEFFDALGITILQGYGLTESSAASFCNVVASNALGTVGPPMPGTQVKIASDGEILIKGPGVMREYYKRPEETAAALRDGWLHTGDIGELDAAGRLRITDRKKDLIKTSGGKYVSPQAIESKFKALCPFAAQAIVHGNNRPAMAMLIALDPEALMAWAKEQGITGTFSEVAANARSRALIAPYVSQLNQGLGPHEVIKHFAVLDRDLTTDSGDLTPSMKLKRAAVEERYRDVIEGFYARDVARV